MSGPSRAQRRGPHSWSACPGVLTKAACPERVCKVHTREPQGELEIRWMARHRGRPPPQAALSPLLLLGPELEKMEAHLSAQPLGDSLSSPVPTQ